jgi:RNA polymerase sigma factor (sigma-70 family)
VAVKTLTDVLHDIGRAAGLRGDLALTDAQLLERFTLERDEPAFAALMARHGPMVFGVCRRLLPDVQEAEDAFQASFLVLARKAAAIQRRPLLAAWLYGVASRVASRLRGRTARRQGRETPAVELDALEGPEDAAWSDVRPMVHEEVRRLPEKYRSPVILCYLEGKTNEEAAATLHWPVGSVKGRLARARDLLRSRLTRRGLGISAGALAGALALAPTRASAALVHGTLGAATRYAAGDPAAGGLATARAMTLTKGVLHTMTLTKLKLAAAAALAAFAITAGVGWCASRLADPPAPAPGGAKDKPADKPADKPTDDKVAIQGVWRIAGLEEGGKEAPDNEETKRMKTAQMVISADKITVKMEGQEDKPCSYKIDPSKKPKELDVTPLVGPDTEKDKLVPGVYSLEGDILKFCLPEPTTSTRPTEVATKDGGKTILITLKREKANKDKPADKDKEAKGDAKAIQGVWQVTSLEVDGAEAPNEGEFKDIRAMKWAFTADKVSVQAKGKAEDATAYRLDPTKNPKMIDIQGKEAAPPGGVPSTEPPPWNPGLYSLDGDVLKLCVSRVKDKRPTEFRTKKGGDTMVLTLSREKGDKDKEPERAKEDKEAERAKEDKEAERAKEDKEAIQGVWLVTSAETGGGDFKKLKANKWIFTADKLTWRLEGLQEATVAYKLDPSKTPKQLDFTPTDGPEKDKTTPAIYGLDGDVLKICVPAPTAGPRPTELVTKKGVETMLFTLKRQPPEKDGK